MDNLLELRADVARRVEDLRIARKFQAEAAAREWTAENVAAYARASRWLAIAEDREAEARGRLIRATLGGAA